MENEEAVRRKHAEDAKLLARPTRNAQQQIEHNQQVVGEEEEYDPFANRPEGPLNSDFNAFMHLLKGAFGTGILFLPNAFRRTGYVMAIVCGVIMGLICSHTAVIVVRCAQTLCKRNHVPMLDLAQTAELSFQSGPARFRKYGRAFAVMTNVVVIFVHFQNAVIYVLYVATSSQQIIEFFMEIDLSIRVYVVLVLPFACALALVWNLKYLVPFSVLGTAFIMLGICISLYYMLRDIPDPARLHPFTEIMPIPMYCTLFLFALHNMTLYMPLENTMKHPGHLPQLIMYSMLINTFVYIVFGYVGYNKYEDACDTIIKNLPVDDPLAQAVKIAVSLSVLFSFGLTYYVPIVIIWPMIRARYSAGPFWEILFRLSGVALTTLLALAVPEMVPLLGLLAAISMNTILLLIPILIETATKWQERNSLLIVKNIFIFCLWLLILIFGVIESTMTIIKEYGGLSHNDC